MFTVYVNNKNSFSDKLKKSSSLRYFVMLLPSSKYTVNVEIKKHKHQIASNYVSWHALISSDTNLSWKNMTNVSKINEMTYIDFIVIYIYNRILIWLNSLSLFNDTANIMTLFITTQFNILFKIRFLIYYAKRLYYI